LAKSLDYFIDEIKISTDVLAICSSSETTDVILFNIDSKREYYGKQNKILSSIVPQGFYQMQASAAPSLMLPIWNAVCLRKAATMSSNPLLRKNTANRGKPPDRTSTLFRTAW
jgi:hypothetical protein